MGEQNQMQNGQQAEQNGQQQVQQQEPVQQQAVQQQVQTEEKKGFGGWLKKHWKGVTATIIGAGTAVGSAVVAYKKGKAAGVMSVPQQEADDYSLDPNRE